MRTVIALTLLLAVAAVAEEPCCKSCTAPENKYYSIDKTHNMCGECCMKDSDFWLYKMFEPGLTKATDNSPCSDNHYSNYSSTVTHGFGPVKMTLDLYSPDEALVSVAPAAPRVRKGGEVWTREEEEANGLFVKEHVVSPRSHDLLAAEALPDAFTWCDKDGVNYCTMSRNQHLPQYCGSCWAHGSVSALGDRVKIARKAKGIDINLSVQHILNCGGVGSCHGGSLVGPYQFVHQLTQSGKGLSYETSNPYFACSSESSEGFCSHANTQCDNNPKAVAYTCGSFSDAGGSCVALDHYPNVTVSEYGTVSGAAQMQAEIYARGPIACGVDASKILDYHGGIVTAQGDGVDHIISVVGWGNKNGKKYWIVRNSWGEYWGDMGYFYVEMGNNAVDLEEQCAWAVVKDYTEVNFPCNEDGSNCQ
jgi:cathepsin X